MEYSRRLAWLAGILICLGTSTAMAGSEEDLIALDKKWGEAGMAGDTDTVAGLLSEDLVGVGEEGVGGKAELLENNEPAPEGATYQADNYNINFLDDNTAIMTHSVAGEETYYSLHVWSKASGNWQVVATATVPAASE